MRKRREKEENCSRDIIDVSLAIGKFFLFFSLFFLLTISRSLYLHNKDTIHHRLQGQTGRERAGNDDNGNNERGLRLQVCFFPISLILLTNIFYLTTLRASARRVRPSSYNKYRSEPHSTPMTMGPLATNTSRWAIFFIQQRFPPLLQTRVGGSVFLYLGFSCVDTSGKQEFPWGNLR